MLSTDGKMILFTAPSGAGKTTIVRHLLETFPDELAFSVSAATRARRPHEQHGVDYYFLSPEEFRAHIAEGKLLEWEEVYQNQYYGTLLSEIDRLWQQGKCVVFDIDVKGATNIKLAYPDHSLAIFVKPPSADVLFGRLRARATEDEASLRRRIARATEELTYERSFDRVILNDDLDTALAEAEQMVRDFLGLTNSKD